MAYTLKRKTSKQKTDGNIETTANFLLVTYPVISKIINVFEKTHIEFNLRGRVYLTINLHGNNFFYMYVYVQ